MGPESRRYHLLVVLFLLAFAAVNTHAQVRTTGSIVGTIRDASGAIGPEAQVEAADVETNIGSTLKAGKDGGFVFATQLRNDILNANSVFNVARNIPKSKLRQNEFGGNLGGPNIKNKLFFFGNYEMIRQPNQDTRTATILNAEAQQGIFRYLDNDNVQRTANLLDIARAAGYPGTIDPFIAQQLATINGTLGGGSVAANDCVPQPGTESRLDAQGDKIMQRLVYRRLGNQESIVAVHSVNSAAGAGGVRWYEFRVDTSSKTKERRLTLHQQGTYAPDNAYRWMASPAIDRRGNIAIGYSFGGTPHYAGQRFAARLASDPKGVMSLRETVLVDGEGVQNAMRWEDYTQTAIDPTDDCTIWYVGDYMKKDITSYSTRIGAFRLPGCGRAR